MNPEPYLIRVTIDDLARAERRLRPTGDKAALAANGSKITLSLRLRRGNNVLGENI